MSEVLGIALRTWLQAYDHFKGADCPTTQDILDETGYWPKINNWKYHSWSQSLQLMERSFQHLDLTGEQIPTFAKYLVIDTSPLKKLARVFGFFANERTIYQVQNVWIGPFMFKPLRSKITDFAEYYRIRVSIDPAFAGSSMFMQVCSCSAIYIPAVVGHPVPEILDRTSDARHFELIIRRPTASKPSKNQQGRHLISELLKTKEKNHHLIESFEETLNILPDPMVIIEKETLVFANTSFAQLSGMTSLEGTSLADLFLGEDLESLNTWLHGSPNLTLLEPKSGPFQNKVLEVRKTPFPERNRTLLIFRNLTEAREIEEKIKKHYQLASLGKLSGSIFHEINSPLTVLNAKIQAMQDLHPEPKVQKLIAESLKELDRIKDSTSTLVGLLKPNGQNGKAKKTLGEVMAEALASCQKLSEKFGTQLMVEPYHRSETIFCPEPSIVIQILIILLTNGIEALAHSDQKKVELSVEKTKKRIRFQVKDWGSGIEDRISEHLFEPLVSTKEDGTGLGLSIAKDLSQKAGFTLQIASHRAPTCFELQVPRGETISI